MKKVAKIILSLLALPLLYLFISIITSYITVNNDFVASDDSHYIVYLHTNSVHLDIAFQQKLIPQNLFKNLKHSDKDQYISFGWGDENFYINTPEWKDLTFKNGFNALFTESSTLMHVTRYKQLPKDWIAISISEKQYQKLIKEISNSFQKNTEQEVILLPHTSYSDSDEFYKANGSYHIFNTCNTWVNHAFKKSGLKACLWTPFDFVLLEKYR